MRWSLTGRGKAQARRVEEGFARAVESSSASASVGQIDNLRARLRQIQQEVHVREQAIASIPEMKPLPGGGRLGPLSPAGRPVPPRPTPRAFAPPLPLPLPAPLASPRRAAAPPIPREEPDEVVEADVDVDVDVGIRPRLPSR